MLGVRGPKSKIEENSFVECHIENRKLTAKKWRFHRETRKKQRFEGAA